MQRLLPELLQRVDVEVLDPEDLRDAGVDIARNGDVDDEQGSSVAAFHHRFDVGPFEQDLARAG